MRIFLTLLIAALFCVGKLQANVSKMVCFYDAKSLVREGSAKFSINDLQPALQFCNYLVYGYAGIDAATYQLQPLDAQLDVYRDHYRAITALKLQNPQLRVLLSVGGDHDLQPDGEPNKYMLLLEDANRRQAFVKSTINNMRSYGFDGLDLAWQFPKNHPKEVKSALKKAWSTFKGWFTGPKPVDEKADEHKQQFTALVRELNSALRQNGAMLTLTMLPNVNPELFIDAFTVVANLDFVNLATFDFKTPERDPKLADYTAPLYELYERNVADNINYHVQWWLNQTTPAHLINIGVPAYGRAWVMSKDSGITGYPPIVETQGVAPAGPQTATPGLLSWPEICGRLRNPDNQDLKGADAPLRKVGDPTHRFGTYAYRSADENGAHGVWVSYEDPISAATKASYVHAKGLGGVAFFDLSLDDFRGLCAGEKYPLLRSIKYKL